jgi:hypothetical protein
MEFSAAAEQIRKITERLSRADIAFYTLPALMALLVIGTLAQADMGLYQAHKTYFAAFVFWVGFVPLPAGYTLLGVLTLNLLLKFLFHSEWSWRKAGIILSHFGALILLLGGLLTALSAREGFMILAEGNHSPFVYDYHQRELMVFEGDRLLHRIDFDLLRQARNGGEFTNLPFAFTVLDVCENCEIVAPSADESAEDDHMTETAAQEQSGFQRMVRLMQLKPKASEKEAEANLAGVTFRLSGLQNSAQNGSYIAFEAMPQPIEITHNENNYKIIFGKSQRRLPFSIKLDEFVKQTYPGTDMARSYHSDVTVLDGEAEWRARIEMNAPLRYKGYTFYQSSFDQSGAVDMSVLSVVENKGRIFPYLGTLVIGLGLLLHIALIFGLRERKQP